MADRSQPARTAHRQPAPGRIELYRRRHPWFDRLVRAAQRYQRNYGDYYAAAITYFSVLALVPLLMIAFAAAGLVLASNPALLERLRGAISESVPSAQLSELVNGIVAEAVEQAGAVGVIGLVAALYSGLGWMGNLREALTAQWGQGPTSLSLPRRMLADLLALLGLGLAMLVSFGLSAVGGGVGRMLLRLAGIQHTTLASLVLWALALVLSLAASWLVFLWVLARLPRQPVVLRTALWGALFAAVGFEVLKQVGVVYLNSLSGSPAAAAFGPVLGLLVFAYLTSRFLLFVTAWTASAGENLRMIPPEPPARAVITPVVSRGGGSRTMLGVFGVGVLLGWLTRRRR
ncbi:inner membrane protein YhjD [Actinopolyspora mortivallis]|uniref:inner membrane protein YhjD n=1 Tax=Actinopolyspora mortivallis TaxID=33906 RepID=UPI0003665FBD|nr:inner membrane protein YhjD [Actinopolyspora mortivallis]